MTRDAFISFLCEEHIPFKIDFPSEQSFIYVNGKDGNYIRVSHFGEHDGKLYVRDNGFCTWYSDELVKEKCRDLRDEKIEKSCTTCKHWGAELKPCDKCYYFDEWESKKEKTEEYLKNAEKEFNEEFNKILQERGFVTTIEVAELFDRIVCGMSEEDIKLKYYYFDHFGIA